MAAEKQCKIIITKNGPYLVMGDVPLSKAIIEGDREAPTRWGKGKEYPKQKNYSLCRCGQSNIKPFCDGSHDEGFDGTETASRKTFAEQAFVLKGSVLTLKDAEPLCAVARFCNRAGGIWKLVYIDDKESKRIAIEEACNCPAGRLVIYDKGRKIEPKYKKSICIVQDPTEGVGGPIFVKGGITIESEDGRKYEVRNRVTLCRCGQSENKPFCDGSHIEVGFKDE